MPEPVLCYVPPDITEISEGDIFTIEGCPWELRATREDTPFMCRIVHHKEAE